MQIPNTQISSGGAWIDYVPVWTSSGTQPSLGNGTITGAYFRFGKLVIANVDLFIGSTSSNGTGFYKFSLPVPAVSSDLKTSSGIRIGVDNSAGVNIIYIAFLDSSTTMSGSAYALDGQAATVWNFLSATFPVTWATSDKISLNFTYEAV